jgi:long-chain acyl-CoA synthetase
MSTPPTRSIADAVRVHGKERPDHIAFVVGDRRISYAQIDAESNRVACALRALGITAHDRVGFLDKNAYEYFPLVIGAGKLDAVTVAVNWRLAAPEIAYILHHAGVKLLLAGPEFVGLLDAAGLDAGVELVVTGDGAGRRPYAEWVAPHDGAEDPRAAWSPNDTCYQLYTSGTTGLPKGVELTHANVHAAMSIVASTFGLSGTSVSLVALPLFHAAGSLWGVAGLDVGATNVLLREPVPQHILSGIASHGVTHALLVPAIMQMLLAAPECDNTEFSTLRQVIYGASPISEPVLRSFMKRVTPRVNQVYGLTETTGAATVLPAADHDPDGPRAFLLRSAGRPMPHTRIRIVAPETGRDVPDGDIGEIWVHGPQTLKGYWRDPDATAAAYPEGRAADGSGWFRTGDAGYLKDGYLFVHDRVKDMIISGGENVYPAEVENALMAHPDVADTAVIGVPDERWGETVKAIVVAKPGTDPSATDLVAWCRQRLAGYKCPTSVDRVAALPRNPSGKILKTELRKPYWQGHDRMVH